jgi:DnaJ-class molecular chaperone
MKLIFALLILLFLTFILCEEDYYKLLGVARNCDEAVLKKAFKKLSLKYHPDKNKKNPEKAKEHYAKIVNAYEVLKDPDTRNAYDKRGVKGVQDF